MDSATQPEPRRTPVPELNVHRQGDGRPLLCLHGVGHHWQAFTPVLGRLASGGFRVIAVDMPGFGASAPLPGEDLSIPAYTDALAVWIESQGLEAPAVVGSSMGGAIALELVRRRVAAMAVAISPAGFWSERERAYTQASLNLIRRLSPAARRAVLAALSTTTGRRLLLRQYFSRPQRIPAEDARKGIQNLWDSPALAGAVEAFSRYRFPGPCPVPPAELHHGNATVAWGSRDLLLPYALQAPRARRELPQARHVKLPGLGHVPFWDDPGMVTRVLLGVLS